MRRDSRTVRRVLPATIALAALLLSVLPAGATPARYCAPWPEVVTSFCVSYDSQFATVQAAAPLTATIIVANESQQVTTVKNTWIETAEISLLAGAGGTPRVTASADLPNG